MGFFAKPAPIETNLPMRDWSELRLPYDGSISSLSRIRMPYLTTLYLHENPLTDLPWTSLTTLSSLYAEYSGLQAADLYLLPILSYVSLDSCYQLDSINAAGNTNLFTVNAYNCVSLTDVNFTGCTNLRYVYLGSSNLPQVLVDAVLAQLVANGTTNGYLDLYGNSAPSAAGIASKNTLISRGWSVTTS